MISYPPRIQLAQVPTPLQALTRLQQHRGGPLIWLKRDDMTGGPLTGNKVRKLEFLFARAKQESCEAVITCGGIQSNHCRATALVAAQLGFDCHLILRGKPDDTMPAQGNELLDKLAGASISYCEPREYFSSLEYKFAAQVEAYKQQGKRAMVIPTGGSNDTGVWGYVAAAEEIQRDYIAHGFMPDAIFCATGSGGTQAGLTMGMHMLGGSVPVYGINVCDDEAYFLNKVSADLQAWQHTYPEAAQGIVQSEIKINVIDGYVGRGYGIADTPVFETIRELATVEGVVLDPVYTGKAFNGLLQEIDQGRFANASNIVFVHTGGIFGLFPFADALFR
ncbi:MAG: D-cysteine desulfhydrase family protein [Gammaproteobacteria bacterium]|nr:D-cysteine desulfhydrase family protein [Gammaproteobacteria bacterium]NND39939.1 D-cysteine desulfhydrase family protein [Pseudomonadales bacterium]NNM10660.1 D-cysteine desulfhydrase family protein [Pseudomonadales bacterium]